MSRQQQNRRNQSPSTDAHNRLGDQRLLDFLAEFKKVDEDGELKSLFQNFCNNQELQHSTYRIVQKERRGSSVDSEGGLDTLETLCQFLLKLYRSSTWGQKFAKNSFIPTSTANDMLKTRVVALQFLPHFVNLHLITRTGGGQRSHFKFVEAFLLAIYNAEVVEQQSFRTNAASIANMPNNPLVRPAMVKVPPIATSSMYHDSSRLESEDKLDQRPSGLAFHFESWSFVENLTASSRPRVLKLLMQSYNRYIVDISKFGLDQFVRATLKMLERGFSQQGNFCQPRVHLDSPVLQELLFSAYVCMYNGFQVASHQIVDLIHARASLSGCVEVLLLSNSIKNLMLNSSPSQVSTTHVSTPVQMAKNMITNASFRAKKMHTDIPKVQVDSVVEESNSTVSSSSAKPTLTSMASIVEEDSTSKDEEKTPSKSESSNKGFNRDKLIAKLQLRKKTMSISEEGSSVTGGGGGTQSASESRTKSSTSEKKEKKDLKAEKKKHREKPDKLEVVSEITPLVSGLNGDSASAASNSSKEYDSVEKVEELIQMRKLPPETITIHSPESGTTIF